MQKYASTPIDGMFFLYRKAKCRAQINPSWKPVLIAAQTANKLQHRRTKRLLASARIIINVADSYASTARIKFS